MFAGVSPGANTVDREEIQWIGYLLKGTDQDGRSTLAAPSPRPTT